MKIRNIEYNNRRRNIIVFKEIFRKIVKDYIESDSINKTINSTIMRNP